MSPLSPLSPPAPPNDTPALDPETITGLLELTEPDDDSFVVELFESWVGSYRACIQGMREAVADSDVQAMRHHAHTLKGSSANVGATHIAELGRKLQQFADAGEFAQCSMWIDACDTEYQRVLEAVRGQFPRFQEPA